MNLKDFKKEKIPDLDYKNFKVILIGVSNYPDERKLKNVPNIKNNIDTLRNVLLDKSIIGIHKKNLFISLNESKVNIEKDLSVFVKQTDENDTLLIYYSGHGFISPESFDLFLASAQTQLDFIDSTGISIKRFRSIISQSLAKRKIVILDACHSGGVHNHLSDNKSFFNAVLNKFDGEYVISSSSDDEPSLYPVKNKNLLTYFTGEFVDILKSGIENGNPYITMSDIFGKLYNQMKNKNLPLPQQSNNNNAGDIPISKNILFSGQYDHSVKAVLPEKYLYFANKVDRDVKIVSRKNTVFNFLTSAIIIIAFISVFIIIKANQNNVALKLANSKTTISNISKSSKINNSENFIIDNENNNENNTQKIDDLIKNAKIFMKADNGYNRAYKTLQEALLLDPDNIEVQFLLDSLESAQN